MNHLTRLLTGKWSAQDIAYSGIIAALYAVLTIALAPLSYGVYQIRVSEALTVLPFIYAPAAVGLFVGCFVANIFGGNGLQDIVFGSLLTLLAGISTALLYKIQSAKMSTIFAPLFLLPLLPIYLIVFYWLAPSYREKLSWGVLLAPLPPVLINAFGVSLYLAKIMEVPYWNAVVLIGAGELVACYALGLPFLIFLLLMKRTPLGFGMTEIESQ